MTIAYWCVLVAGLLPYVTVAIAKWDKSFDNNHPRDWEAQLEGRKKRAHHAHLNSFEAFPLFAVAVIIAHQLHGAQILLDMLAVIFIASRVLYVWSYLEDKATLRSVVWIIGLGSSIALFVVAAWA